uniref:Uncharacterized protein n=1 Tax=Rhizophora mucronata TaxID=61149 RepID=A0A2P2P585_RHIMU
MLKQPFPSKNLKRNSRKINVEFDRKFLDFIFLICCNLNRN